MGRIDKYILKSAGEWNIPPGIARWIFWLPWIGSIAMAALRWHKPIYRYLLFEDGPVEWAQFAFFVVACVAGGLIAQRLLRRRLVLQAALFACYAAAMCFMAGEEIAWGQRLFDIETPEQLRAVNRQGEITVHNIGSIKEYFNLAMLFGGAAGGLLYVANRRLRLQRYMKRADVLFVPPFFLSSAFLITAVYEFVRLTIWHESGFTITKYAEWSEFCLASGLAAFSLLILRRLNAESRQPAASFAATQAADDSPISQTY